MPLPILLSLLAGGTTSDPNPVPGIRQASTIEDIFALCTAKHRSVECFHDLLDQDENVLPVAGLSRDVKECVVRHNETARIHGSVALKTVRELPWESTRSRFSVRLTAPALYLSATWVMGVYLLDTPQRTLGETPELWIVDGSDKLTLLDEPVGRTYVLSEGMGYCAEMERIIREECGESNVLIDQSAVDKVAPADRVWAFSDNVTWLDVLTDMAKEVNYREPWADRDGCLRVDANLPAAQRPLAFRFDTTNVAPQPTYDRPLSTVPNVWYFYRRSTSQGLPVDDDGIYLVENQADGPTSIQQRRRRKAKQVALDASDEDDFKAQADAIVAADKNVAARLDVATVLLPSLWRGDVAEYTDAHLGGPLRVTVEEWEADLTGTGGAPVDMAQSWRAA